MKRSDVAALFVDPRGVYPRLVEEWFDEERDARSYAGTLPVVAHPPCGPWARLRHLSKRDLPELAPWAVALVRRVGGVLEHPAMSTLWSALDLPRPGDLPDRFGGQTIEVCQVDWGHPARKRTWLYIVGAKSLPPFPPPREPTHWASGSRSTDSTRTKQGQPVPPGIKVCSARQRRRTPEAFALWLLEIAAGCKGIA